MNREKIFYLLKEKKTIFLFLGITICLIVILLLLGIKNKQKKIATCNTNTCPSGCCIDDQCLTKNFSQAGYTCLGQNNWIDSEGKIISVLPAEIISKIEDSISLTKQIPQNISVAEQDNELINLDQQKKICDYSVSVLLPVNNVLWIGSDTDGLYVLENENIRKINTNIQVFSLLPDDKNRLIVGYIKFQQKPVTEQKNDKGEIIVTYSKPVFLEGEKEIGIGLWDGLRWRVIYNRDTAWGLAKINDDGFYFSTNKGVFFLKDGKSISIGPEDILSFGMLSENKTIFLGAMGGIWSYTNNKWNQVLKLDNNKVFSFHKTIKGDIYAATAVGLYSSVDGLVWQAIGDKKEITAVSSDSSGRIFIGGSEGLYYIKNNRLIKLTGRIDVQALAFYNGILYVGTNSGLWSINLEKDIL